MEERLLLDGIDCFGGNLSEGCGIERTAAVDADAADPLLSLPYGAPVGTERAADGVIFQFLIESRFVHMTTA